MFRGADACLKDGEILRGKVVEMSERWLQRLGGCGCRLRPKGRAQVS